MTITAAERSDLRAAVGELLDRRCTEADLRRVIATDDGFDRDLWTQLANQGVPGMLVDERYGGMGFGALECWWARNTACSCARPRLAVLSR